MRYSPVLLAGLIALSGACRPVDPEKTTRAVEWLEHYYKKEKFPAVKGGTGFVAFKVKADGHELQVYVWTPVWEHARMLRGMDISQKVRYWELIACPPRGAAIWTIKDKNQYLTVELRGPTTFDEDFIVNVICK